MQMSLNKKEELEHKLETREKKCEKEETITCTSSDHQQNVVITDQPVQMEETCHNNNQEKNETLDEEDAVAGPQLKCAYRRKGKALRVSQVSKGSELHTGKRQVQASNNLFSQVTSRHQLVHLERQQRDIQISPATITGGFKEIKDGKPDSRWQTYCTSTDNRTGTLNDHQQNVVIVNQPVPVEKTLHNSNQEEIDMLDKDEKTRFPVHYDYCYERRKSKRRTSKCVSEVCKQSKLDKGKTQAQASSVFSKVTSRLKARLEEQRREIKISPATITRVITPVETVSSKSSKKGRGRKSKALTGRSSRSVPRQRKRKSGTLVQQDIEEIEDGEINNRRWSYLLGKNEKAPSIFDHSPKGFDLVNTHIGYQESLLNFAKNLGPTVQSLASKKLKQLSLAQTTADAFQAPFPHQPLSAWRLSNNPKGKSVIMDKGCGRKSISAGDLRPMRPFDRVDTLSAGSAYIASSLDTSRIQRPADVVHKAVRGNVHFPTSNQNQLVLQQQQHHHLPPSNAPVLNADTVRPGYQIPIVYEARPMQSAYPSITGRPSSLSAMCHASGSGYGVWSGHQSTPLNEVQRQANPASFGQGFQQTLNNSLTQLQNQLELEAHQQQRMGFEQQPLPILSNMFDTGTSSSVRNHQTTYDAGRNAQQLPLAHCTYTNLELQLRTKPLSPDEAS